MKKKHANLNRVLKYLYDKTASAVLFKETGSEQQLESDRHVYSHPLSSTYFWKGS